MSEVFLILCALLILVALLIGIVVLPIIALLRTRHLGEILQRLERIEEEIGRRQASQEEALADVLPVTETASAKVWEARRVEQPPPAPRAVARARSTALSADALSIETWIGRRGLGWVAVVLLLFATAFFLKYAFDNQWIGPLGRVSSGILIGVALCGAGLHYHRRGWWIFSQMLTAGGVVVLYLAMYSAFGYYHLIPAIWAAVFLIVLIAESVALAVLYEAPAIAIMAVIGGLLNPILLHTGHDQYVSLFIYLAVLNAGVVGLSLVRAWPALGTVALLGTQGLFWLWYHENYHPAKLTAALSFQVVLVGLYLSQNVMMHVWRKRKAGIEDLARLLLNAFLFATALYVLVDDDYHAWLGSLALLLALVYTLLGWLLFRQRDCDERLLFVTLATAMAFVAMVFPVQAQAAWIPLGWAVQGLVLWWFGLRLRSNPLCAFGAVLLGLAVSRLVFIDTPPFTGRPPFVPFFNKYGLPAAAVAACVLGAAAASRRFLRPNALFDRAAMWSAGVTGVLLVWFLLTTETYGYFTARIEQRMGAFADRNGEMVDEHGRPLWEQQMAEETGLRRTAQMALSVVWAIYAGMILGIGFWRHNGPLRWTGLGIFAVTLGKVMLLDMAALPGFYRVIAFLALAVMMGAAAWGYQRVMLTRQAQDREGASHEAG